MTELFQFSRSSEYPEDGDEDEEEQSGNSEEGSYGSDSASGSLESEDDDDDKDSNDDDEPVLKYKRFAKETFAKEAVTSVGDQGMVGLKVYISSIAVHSKVSTSKSLYHCWCASFKM